MKFFGQNSIGLRSKLELRVRDAVWWDSKSKITEGRCEVERLGCRQLGVEYGSAMKMIFEFW